MKDPPSTPPAGSVVCGGFTRTRSMPSSGRSIFDIFCPGESCLRFFPPLRKLMRLTIFCNLLNRLSGEKFLCLYVHTSNVLASKGRRSFGLSSLILFLKWSTLVSACTAISAQAPKLSWRWWSTRRYQIVFAGASAGFGACFPLANPLGAMMRVASGGVKRDELLSLDFLGLMT